MSGRSRYQEKEITAVESTQYDKFVCRNIF